MTAPELKGPGLLFVNSRISRPDLLDEEAFMKWYGEDHISDILKTSGIKSALCFKNADPAAEKPYLVLYPMQDIGFIQGDEFKKIGIHSDLLPNGGPIYDYADMFVRYYNLIDTYEPNGPTIPGTLESQT